MSDPRQEDLRATYDEVSTELETLATTEARKQAARPGTERHARLALEAKQSAERLRRSTAIEAALAEELESDPGPGPT